MNTTLLIIAGIVIISTLYILKDTITEALSGGKSFMPNEMKGFSGSQNPKLRAKLSKKENRLLNVFLDTAAILIALYILVRVGSYIFSTLNF